MANALGNLSMMLVEQGPYAEAEPLYRDALAIRRESQAPDHPHIWADLEALATLYERWGRTEQALAVRRELATLFPESERR